ncbi:MAG: hypothetical protein ACTSQE_14365 [Candidatus Heimdallarchaeaceae archaeon]
MFNPINTILNTSKKLVNYGRDYFDNVKKGAQTVNELFYQPKVKEPIGKFVDKGISFAGEVKSGYEGARETVKQGIPEIRERSRDEAAKATLRSTSGLLTTTSRGITGMGNLDDKLGSISKAIPGFSGFSATRDVYNRFSNEDLKDTASRIAMEGAETLNEKASFIDQYDREGITLDDVKQDPYKAGMFAVQSLSQAAPSIAIATIGSIVSGGVGVFAVGAGMEGGSQWQEAKEFGATDAEADLAGTLNGLISGALEKFGFSMMTKNNPLMNKLSGNITKELLEKAGKDGIVKFFQSMISEGGTEAAQQYVSNVIAKNIYDSERDLSEGVLESGIVGGLAGGGMHIGGAGAAGIVDISQKANKIYKKAEPKEKEGGYISVGKDNDVTSELIREDRESKNLEKLHKAQGSLENAISKKEIYGENNKDLLAPDSRNFTPNVAGRANARINRMVVAGDKFKELSDRVDFWKEKVEKLKNTKVVVKGDAEKARDSLSDFSIGVVVKTGNRMEGLAEGKIVKVNKGTYRVEYADGSGETFKKNLINLRNETIQPTEKFQADQSPKFYQAQEAIKVLQKSWENATEAKRPAIEVKNTKEVYLIL